MDELLTRAESLISTMKNNKKATLWLRHYREATVDAPVITIKGEAATSFALAIECSKLKQENARLKAEMEKLK